MNDTSTLLAPVLCRAGAGRTIRAMDDTMQVKLDSEQTGGALMVAMMTAAPFGGPPPHVHHDEDEIFIVQSGTLEVTVDGTHMQAGPGDVVFLPRGVPHCFRNLGDTPARVWLVATPGGFERFYGRFADVCNAPGGPDLALAAAVGADHGIEFLPPPAA